MNIIEAAQAMKDGKSVRCKSWDSFTKSISKEDFQMPDDNVDWLEADGILMLDLDDLLATDWEIV